MPHCIDYLHALCTFGDMAKRAKKVDWRKLPRKAAALKRSMKHEVHLTPAEHKALIDAAKAEGVTVAEFIRSRCLSS